MTTARTITAVSVLVLGFAANAIADDGFGTGRRAATVLVAGGEFGGFSVGSSYDTYHHIDELAFDVQKYTSSLYWEFRHHYSHTPDYQHLISDASQMYYLAKHIHEIAHHHGSVYHLEHDLEKLDRLFHHLENLVDEIEHEAFHGHGHVHGHTGHVRSMLRRTESLIHHLQRDVRELAAELDHHHHDHHHGRFHP
ncbi:MAG: hypothetical protein ACREIV_13065 [Planctomycetaceae bacterium]